MMHCRPSIQAISLCTVQNGSKSLFIAAQRGSEGCTKLLLDANAEVDIANYVSGQVNIQILKSDTYDNLQ